MSDPYEYANSTLGSAGQGPSLAPSSDSPGFEDPYAYANNALSPEPSPEEYLQQATKSGLAAGRSPEEHAAHLSKKGYSPQTIKLSVQQYKLDQASKNLGRFPGGKETIAGSMLHQAKEHFIPFRSWFVNPEQGEADASARFQQGQATDADIQILARARRRQEDEQQLHETVAGQVVSAMRDAPAIMGEYMAGAGLLSKSGVLQANRVSSIGQLLSGAGRTALVTAAMPSMYMADARQKNLEAGRDPNDWRGLPSAGLHAFAQMVVLGRVFKGASAPTSGLAAGVGASLKGGLAGGIETALADSVTHMADFFIPEAYKLSTGDGTFEKLMTGDVSGSLRKYATDALTLGMFAGIHKMADGLSPTEAAQVAKNTLETVKDLPAETVAKIRGLVKASPDVVPDVINHLANPEFRSAYREAAKITHPDRGGSIERFQALNDALLHGDLKTMQRIAKGEVIESYTSPPRSMAGQLDSSNLADLQTAIGVEQRARAMAAQAHEQSIQGGLGEEVALANAVTAYKSSGGRGQESVLAGRRLPTLLPVAEKSLLPRSEPSPAQTALKGRIAKPGRSLFAAEQPELTPESVAATKLRPSVDQLTPSQGEFLKNEVQSEISPEIEMIVNGMDLTKEEALVIKGMLAGFAPSGTKLSSGLGYSRETTNQLAAKAMKKVREQLPQVAEHIELMQDREAGRRGTGTSYLRAEEQRTEAEKLMIRHIQENPFDETARLALADILEENGFHERAKTIREESADPVADNSVTEWDQLSTIQQQLIEGKGDFASFVEPHPLYEKIRSEILQSADLIGEKLTSEELRNETRKEFMKDLIKNRGRAKHMLDKDPDRAWAEPRPAKDAGPRLYATSGESVTNVFDPLAYARDARGVVHEEYDPITFNTFTTKQEVIKAHDVRIEYELDTSKMSDVPIELHRGSGWRREYQRGDAKFAPAIISRENAQQVVNAIDAVTLRLPENPYQWERNRFKANAEFLRGRGWHEETLPDGGVRFVSPERFEKRGQQAAGELPGRPRFLKAGGVKPTAETPEQAVEQVLAEGVAPAFTAITKAMAGKLGREVSPSEMEQLLGPVGPRLIESIAAADVSPIQKETYSDAANFVTGRMPDMARARMAFHMADARYYEGAEESMTGAVRQVAEENPNDPFAQTDLSEQQANPSEGAAVTSNGSLHIDGGLYSVPFKGRYGGYMTAEMVAAHEFGHLIDGPMRNVRGEIDNRNGIREISDSREWREAYRQEIMMSESGSGTPKLTEYASTSSAEGFAEFCRLLYGTDLPTEQIARDFPMASKVMQERGLWPEGREGPVKEAKLPEAFGKMKVLADGSHVDVIAEPPSHNLLSKMKAPRLEEAKGLFWRAADWIRWASGGGKKVPVPGVLLDNDPSHILPRIQQNDWEGYKDIVVQKQGAGRVPFFGWMFDPGRSDTGPDNRVLVANKAFKEDGKNVAAHWGISEKVADSLFKHDELQQYTRGDGSLGHMGDDIEAEMEKPGSVKGLSDQQRDWIRDVWTPLYRDSQAMKKEMGITQWTDAYGHVISTSKPAYFPRPVIQKKGIDRPVGPSAGSRLYESEAEGSKTTIYDPSAKSRVVKFIAGHYSAIANYKMANDAALQGKTPEQRFNDLVAQNRSLLTVMNEDARRDLEAELHQRAAHPLLGKEAFVQSSSAFRGKIYPIEIADKIESMFRQESSDWLRTVEKVSASVKGIALGGDASYAFIQLLPTMFRNPALWAKSMREAIGSIYDPLRLARFVEQPEVALAARELTQLGSSVGRLSDFISGLGEGEFATKIPIVGRAYASAGRAFGVALDVAKIELWRAWKPMAHPTEYRALAEGIDSMLLSGRMEGIGLSARRAMTERLMMLAPSYYRGGLNLIATAFQRGMPGKLARQALGATMTGIAISSVAGMYAMGLTDDEIEERLNPARGKFLKIPVELGDQQKIEVGYGNILTSYIRLLGAGADHFSSDRPVDTGADGNPMLRWLRGKSAMSPRLMIDLWTGKDFFGKRQQPQEALLRAIEPIALQQIIHGDNSVFENGVVDPQSPARSNVADAIISMFGLTSYGGSDADRKLAIYDQSARHTFSTPYSQLSLHKQAIIVKASEGRPDMPVRKPSTPDEMERAFSARIERTQRIMSKLPDDQREFLEKIGETVPAPMATIHIGGVDVPLTNAMMRKYEGILASQYSNAIRSWNSGVMSGMPAEQRKRWIERQFQNATEVSKRMLIAESEKSN